MNGIRKTCPSIFFLLFVVVLLAAREKPWAVVTTDIGGDLDGKSLVRLLVCSDQFDMECACERSSPRESSKLFRGIRTMEHRP